MDWGGLHYHGVAQGLEELVGGTPTGFLWRVAEGGVRGGLGGPGVLGFQDRSGKSVIRSRHRPGWPHIEP